MLRSRTSAQNVALFIGQRNLRTLQPILTARLLRLPSFPNGQRFYAQGPFGGAGGGFPGFRMQQQEPQKGEALNEYVRLLLLLWHGKGLRIYRVLI